MQTYPPMYEPIAEPILKAFAQKLYAFLVYSNHKSTAPLEISGTKIYHSNPQTSLMPALVQEGSVILECPPMSIKIQWDKDELNTIFTVRSSPTHSITVQNEVGPWYAWLNQMIQEINLYIDTKREQELDTARTIAQNFISGKKQTSPI